MLLLSSFRQDLIIYIFIYLFDSEKSDTIS